MRVEKVLLSEEVRGATIKYSKNGEDFYSIIMTIQFSVKEITFYDESSFFKIIGDAFRTEYVVNYQVISHTDNSNLKLTVFL